jgi:hypothetical protein
MNIFIKNIMRKVTKEAVNGVIDEFLYDPDLTPGDVILRILKLKDRNIDDIETGEIIENVLNERYKYCIFKIMERLKMRCTEICVSDMSLLLDITYGIRDLSAFRIKQIMDEINKEESNE